MKQRFKDLPEKLMVLLSAWPTLAASLTAVLAVVGTELVPKLPGDWPVKAAAWVAAALAMITVISAAVARVTPIVFKEEKGLLPLPPAPKLEFDPDKLKPLAEPHQYPAGNIMRKNKPG